MTQFFPATGTSLGLFVPVLYTDPNDPIAILADPIDFKTGEYLSIERGFDPTDADVMFALAVERGSGSAVEDVGQKFNAYKKVDPGLVQFMKEECRLALRHLTESRDVELVAVEPVGGTDYVDNQIRYVNLARQREEKLPLRPMALLGSV